MSAGEDNTPAEPPDEQPVPKLPRGRTFRLAGGQMMTIGLLLICLFAVIAMRNACSTGVGNMLNAFEEPPRDPSIVPAPPPTDMARELAPTVDAADLTQK